MDNNKKGIYKIIEIVNGRSTNYAVLFMISMLALAGILVGDSSFAFILAIVSIAIVFFFSLIWNIVSLAKHRPIPQCKGGGDLAISILSQILFIALCITWFLRNQLLIEILAYIGAATLLAEILYLMFRQK